MDIAQLGNPILRDRAQPIDNAATEVVTQLAKDLIATAEVNNGVGIAAPQVSQSCRLFIMASRPNLRYPHAPTMEPTAVINPVILQRSEEIIKGWEGCLSVPGLRGLIPRHQEIEVEYSNLQGDRQRQILTDFVARIFQHELDHLNGLLFIDRLESTQDLYTEAEYLKRIL